MKRSRSEADLPIDPGDRQRHLSLADVELRQENVDLQLKIQELEKQLQRAKEKQQQPKSMRWVLKTHHG